MNEEQLIQKIIHLYDESHKNINLDIIIPRDKLLIEFTNLELETLQKLIDDNISLNFELLDKSLNKTFELEDDAQIRTIFHQTQNYLLKNITFNYASAMIWISVMFKEEIDQLIQEVFIPEPIDKKDISVALIIALICFSAFFITYGGIPELLGFAIFAAGFLAIGFIYDKIKSRFTNNSESKINERRFHASQYLTAHLAEHAHQKLKLDIIE